MTTTADLVTAARRTQTAMLDALRQADDRRDERDDIITAMHFEHGMTPGMIHRQLGDLEGLSLSNVQHILRYARRRRQVDAP